MRQLVQQLHAPDALVREAAVARLRILGSRIIPRLAEVMTDADAASRAAALKVLEGVDDARVPGIALQGFRDPDPDVRLAAIAALRPWVTRNDGPEVIDALVPAALDRAEPAAIRLAALDALSDLPRDIVQPVVERSRLETIGSAGNEEDDPAAVQQWLAAHDHAPLSALHALIVRLRERELAEAPGVRRREWLAVRGAVHAVLAGRRSRVALYDLREAFDAAGAPLPLDYLTAMAALGDATCLEPLARAWASASPSEEWWRTRLAETAASIVRGQRLSARHAAVKRIRARWPGFV